MEETEVEIKYICKLTDTTFEIDPNLIEALGASPGDRIEIAFTERAGLYKPVIFVSENGKKLSKKNSIRFSGKENIMLAEYGTVFTVYPNESDSKVFTMYGHNPKVKVFTTVDKAVEYLSHFPKEVITDNNYIIKKYKEYEF